jgi:Putative 2OG-Fe(II) oxygenase
MKYDISEYSADLHFSSAIYRINREDLLPLVKPIFNEYLTLAEKNTKRDDIYPFLMTQEMSNDERISPLTSYVANISWDILNSQGYYMDPLFTRVTAMWGQNHPRTSGMDYHIHNDAILNGFYFIDAPEGSSDLIIHDPRHSKIARGLQIKNSEEIFLAHDQVFYTPVSGDLLFTNGWLPHSFTRNRNNKPFNFIHININVVDNPNFSIQQKPEVI